MAFKCVMASLLAIHISGNRLLLQLFQNECQLNQCINTGNGEYSKRGCDVDGNGVIVYYFDQTCTGEADESEPFPDPCCTQTTTTRPPLLFPQSTHSGCQLNQCINTGIYGKYSKRVCGTNGSGGTEYYSNQACSGSPDSGSFQFPDSCCTPKGTRTTTSSCQLNQCITTGIFGEYLMRYCDALGGSVTNYYFNQACSGGTHHGQYISYDPCCTQTNNQKTLTFH